MTFLPEALMKKQGSLSDTGSEGDVSSFEKFKKINAFLFALLKQQ